MQVEEGEVKRLVEWMEKTPSVSRGWVFGSRAKDCAQHNSDLDVALELIPEDGEVLAEWIEYSKDWKDELNTCTDIRPVVDLQLSQPMDQVVGPAVSDHGILIFSRGS